jgi:hypothetical protein
MPLLSKAQQGWMFANKPQMALRWAHETPNMKGLPEHVKKKSLRKLIKGRVGKGGPIPTSYKQAASPIDLLKTNGEPPTVRSVVNS